jgi:hypothetical protein
MSVDLAASWLEKSGLRDFDWFSSGRGDEFGALAQPLAFYAIAVSRGWRKA